MKFFLERPILSITVSLFIVILGIACLKHLPVTQYPPITPPVVTVQANFPGATAQTLSESVAAPLEKSINGVENMIYMFSQNATPGRVQISVYFEVGSNPDIALVNTQNRVNLAIPSLPEEVRNQGVTVERTSPSVLLFIGIYDLKKHYDPAFVNNYAAINIVDELQRIKGVNSATVLNARDYAMRIWLNPDRLGQYSLTTSDVAAAVRAQNALYSIGQIGQEPTATSTQLTIPVTSLGRLNEPSEFEDIILRANADGSTVLLKDVGRVELGAKSYNLLATANGEEGAFIAIYQDSESNALDISKQVRQKMEDLSQSFPPGITYQIPYDTTTYIKYSIKEILFTLLEAALLVFLVIYFFLHSLRAAFIPLIAMIVSIIGTFIGLYALGYSINTLSLFGMILAIGIVVDDAIVIVENIEYNITVLGFSPKEAAIKTLHSLTGPVIAIVFALCSVFIPVAFIGGIPGQFYKQFALTIVTSVIISGFVALTLSPVLAVFFFKKKQNLSRLTNAFNRLFDHLTHLYLRGVDWILGKTAVAAAFFVALLLAIVLLLFLTPLGFIPNEDQGLVLISATLPDGASLSRVKNVSEKIEKIVRKSPAVQDILAVSGYSLIESIPRTSSGAYFVALKDWGQRKSKKLHAEQLIEEFNQQFSHIPEARIHAANPPNIPGIGVIGGFDFWVVNNGNATLEQLGTVVTQIIEKAKQNPAFSMFISHIEPDCMELYLELDKVKAGAYGVRIEDVYNTLQTLLGSVYINDFNRFGKSFQVVAQAEPSARDTIGEIGNIYVRSKSNQMIPLKSLVTSKFSKGPTLVSRFNGSPAALISVVPNAGPETVISEMEKIAKEFLLPGMGFSWGGVAYQEKETGGVSGISFIGGFFLLFLTLAALYERWSLPCIVLLAVPFGIFGALLAIWLRGQAIDIYFQIALVALIGLSAKNGILIVEIARQLRQEGKGAVEAAREAAHLRFRPVLMTSLTLIFGVLPLVFSSGAGAASRHSVGTGVIGGMIFATFLALLFVPFFFRLIEKWREKREKK